MPKVHKRHLLPYKTFQLHNTKTLHTHPHTIPYNQNSQLRTNNKKHTQTHPQKHRNLLSQNQTLSQTNPFTSNKTPYTPSNTPPLTTTTLLHTHAFTLIQTDTPIQQQIHKQTNSPPTKQNFLTRSLSSKKICSPITFHGHTLQPPPSPDPHTPLRTQHPPPNLRPASVHHQQNCPHNNILPHKTTQLCATTLTPNSQPRTPPNQPHTPTLSSRKQTTNYPTNKKTTPTNLTYSQSPRLPQLHPLFMYAAYPHQKPPNSVKHRHPTLIPYNQKLRSQINTKTHEQTHLRQHRYPSSPDQTLTKTNPVTISNPPYTPDNTPPPQSHPQHSLYLHKAMHTLPSQ